VAPGALNVASFDERDPHQVRVVHAGSDEVVATFTFRHGGQVVANDALAAAPALYEARCSVHADHRAWIAVFDHPYWAITAADGSFSMEGVPPGTYRVAAWREGKRAEGTVQVAANGEGKVTLDLK